MTAPMMNAQAAKGYSAANLQMKKNNIKEFLQISNLENVKLMVFGSVILELKEEFDEKE